MTQLNYWYFGQIRGILTQFVRVFGNINIKTGKGKDGTETLYRVPVRYADMSRMVGHVLKQNSDNKILPCPMITCMLSGWDMAPEDRQNPTHVDAVNVTERAIDRLTGKYTGQSGEALTVERYMPVPYKLTLETHLWTKFTDHKLQLLEQILVWFNPSIDLQFSDNPVDWSALSYLTLTNVSWSDRSIPQGTDDQIDVAKLTFELPIKLNPPAKVKRQKLIQSVQWPGLDEFPGDGSGAGGSGSGNLGSGKRVHQINTNIRIGTPEDLFEPEQAAYDWAAASVASRVVVTPGQHMLRVEGDVLTLLDPEGRETTPDGKLHDWRPFLSPYGKLEEGISQIRIRSTADLEDWTGDIIGTVQFHPTAVNKLLWTLDPETLPRTDLLPIIAIINPHRSYPGHNLPVAIQGHRYIVTDEVGPDTAWGNLTAVENDIIEYRGGTWVVASRMAGDPNPHFVTNAFDRTRLRWTGEEWVDAVNADYYPGYWRLSL